MNKLKESNVVWIGKIPEHWEIKPISACFKERNEKVSDYDWEPLSVTKQGIVKQLETAAKSDAHDARKKVCFNDFVINSRSDRKQSCGLSRYDGSVSLINIVLTPTNIEPNYTNYLLKNYGFAEEFYRFGSGIVADLWSTNYSKMKRIFIPIPPAEEQNKIANFLDKELAEIDVAIEKTKETINDYKILKQSIITKVVSSGLDSSTEFKQCNDNWIESIPKNWQIRKLKSLCEVISKGATPSSMGKDKSDEFPVAFVKAEAITNGKIDYDKVCYISEKDNKTLERSQLRQGDILFVIAGSIGKCGVVDDVPICTNINQAISFIRLKPQFIKTGKYLYYYFQSNYSLIYSNLNTVKSALPNLSMENLGNMKITLPKDNNKILEIINYLDDKCNEIDSLIASKEKIVEELEKYKKSVIYEYVTGKKEVK